MAWTTPVTWTVGQIVGASDLNTQIRDNENFLLNGKARGFTVIQSTYSTGSTSFVDMDATNLILTLNVTTGRVFVVAGFTELQMSNTATCYAAVDIIVDSTTRLGNATYGLAGAGQNSDRTVAIAAQATGLSVASHTFKIQWKAGNGGTASIGVVTGGALVYFGAFEI